MDEEKKQVSDDNKKRLMITRFEDLSNELVYEIFDFLDGCYIHEAFSDLNGRFQDLLTYSSVPLKINMLFTPKSIFQHRCKSIIIPNMHRIVSLCLSNLFTVELFLSMFTIDASFTCLESLILDNVKSAQLVSLLNSLVFAPRLSYLTIIISDSFQEHNDVYRLLFRLPVLKYVKIQFEHGVHQRTLPIATNEQEHSSTIEHLIIAGSCYLDGLCVLVSYTPRLSRLSCRSLNGFKDTATNLPKLPTNLTHISIEDCALSFDELELFISKLSSQLQVLRICRAAQDTTYLNADLWQQLFSRYAPNLRTFDFFHRSVIDDGDDGYSAYHALINQFTSSYWIEQKWHFAHRHYYFWDGRSADFYSSQSYWKKNGYDLFERKDNETCIHQDTGINVARVLSIMGSQSTIAECSLRFPYATTLGLTIPLCCEEGNWNQSFFNDLTLVVHLTQLTQLYIDYINLSLTMLLELLLNAPNVHSLHMSHLPLLQMNYLTTDEIERFRLVSNRNKITKVTIYQGYELNHINEFIGLYPQVESLDIRISNCNLESIIQFLSLKKSDKSCRLFSLRLSGVQKEMVKNLQTMIDQKKIFDEYSIEGDFVNNSAVCLWW